MERLKKRREFLKVQGGRRARTGLFSVQALPRPEGGPSRVGFTVSKRVSPSAVKRNRIRRRLKEAMRRVEAPGATDYVVVARIEALNAAFGRLTSELHQALGKAAAPRPADPAHARPPGPDPKAI
jgi:ribonuclease P protein component